MKDDAVLVSIAKSLTGKSWSMSPGGFGGLGDRVSRRSVSVKFGEKFDLFDIPTFIVQLERLVIERQQPVADIEAVETFLNACTKRHGGRAD